MDTRTQIRNKVIEIINTIPTLNNKVYYDFLYAIRDNKLPCAVVVTGGETYENISIGRPFIIEKTLTLAINVITQVKNDYQSELDNLKNLIEKKLNETNTLEDLVQTCYIQNITQEIDDDEGVAIAYNTINLEIIYRVMSNNIDNIL